MPFYFHWLPYTSISPKIQLLKESLNFYGSLHSINPLTHLWPWGFPSLHRKGNRKKSRSLWRTLNFPPRVRPESLWTVLFFLFDFNPQGTEDFLLRVSCITDANSDSLFPSRISIYLFSASVVTFFFSCPTSYFRALQLRLSEWMNERLSSGQLQSEKACGLAVFPVPMRVCPYYYLGPRSLKVMQFIQIQSCANFFLSPLDTSSIWQVRKWIGVWTGWPLPL